MISYYSILSFLVIILCVPSMSQTVCNSTLTGTFSSISVQGSSCTLKGVDVQFLTVVDGGSLRTLGESRIFLITARNAGNIYLSGRTIVRGPVSFMNSGDITIGKPARVSEIVMGEPGILKLQGSLMRLASSGSGRVIINGGVLDGTSSPLPMFISRGNPSIRLCGATIGRAQLSSMPARIFSFKSPSCSPSTIRSLTLVEPSGSIAVKGVNILETFSTVEDFELRVKYMSISSTKIGGEVTVENVGKTLFTSVQANETFSLSNVQSTRIIGSILKGNVIVGATPELSLVPTQQSLFSMISGCDSQGDVTFGALSGSVTITGSTFFNKSVEIGTLGGSVRLTGNSNLNLKVQNNSVGVTVIGNRIWDGILFNNRAIVKLIRNTFETLSCNGNDPLPSLVNTVVANGGSGQCALA